jgi:chromosome segregation ATPase
MAILQDDVDTACDALAADGRRITQRAVRDALGGGSYSTIGPMIETWRKACDEAAELAAVEVPDAIAARMSEAAAAIWRAAVETASVGHASMRDAVAAADAATEAARSDAAEVIADLEARLADTERGRNEARSALAEAQAALDALRIESARLEERLAAKGAEMARADAERDDARSRAEAAERRFAALEERVSEPSIRRDDRKHARSR